jgi:hypothetical protein
MHAEVVEGVKGTGSGRERQEKITILREQQAKDRREVGVGNK